MAPGAQQLRRTIRTVADLDGEWLAAALGCGPIDSFSAQQIGTGQMSESHRVSLRYADERRAGPATVVLKLASADESSRATGLGLGIYEREVRFYEQLAPRLGGPLAGCHFASYEQPEGWFTLLLEDAAPAVVGDQLAGCDADRARLVMRELALLHAPVLEDAALSHSGWLNRPSPVSGALVAQLLPGFLERYGDSVAAEHAALSERFAARADTWLAQRSPPLGLVHGDFRLDNLLFGQPGSARALTVVDWQTVAWGSAMADAAYFLGGGLAIEQRREHEHELLDAYHGALCELGVRDLAFEDCWRQYREQAFGGVLMAIVASMLVQRTDRGDEMFMAMLARHSQQALDLDSEALLAQAVSVQVPALRPDAADEAAHACGPERLWNESWYFDAVSADGRLGVYVRLGLYPNLGLSWYTALVCGPGRATVAAIDFAAPLPQAQTLELQTAQLRALQRCEQPLERYAVKLSASARSYEDAADLLRGAQGRELPLELALDWQTDGEPYSYRLTTRYEIPCRVHGTIRVGAEMHELAGAPGQRDHSWGLRDWWSMDWMWSALHLEDGTHVHAVQLRLPDSPPLGMGYVQARGEAVVELARVDAEEQMRADGLIERAQLRLAPPRLELDVEPLAFGPLRLESPDGRVSHFPRALCRVRMVDGRSGVGWLEWNLNQASL